MRKSFPPFSNSTPTHKIIMKPEDLVSPEMKQHAHDLKAHAREGVDNIRQDVSNLAQDTKDHARRSVDLVKDEATARLNDAKGRASDLFESAKAYATLNPLQTFVIGVVLGLFLARRRHHHAV
jgi:ElaB/YqjD/DUF883 family membrane-anchored ribosome-binding protein